MRSEHSYADALQEVESVLGIRYPPQAAHQLSQLPSVPGMTVLVTPDDVARARREMPSHLLPFMSDPQSTWSDYYAFDLNGSGVAVWADHAVVMEWPSFAAFLDGLAVANR